MPTEDLLVGNRSPKWQGDFRVLTQSEDGHPLLYLSLSKISLNHVLESAIGSWKCFRGLGRDHGFACSNIYTFLGLDSIPSELQTWWVSPRNCTQQQGAAGTRRIPSTSLTLWSMWRSFWKLLWRVCHPWSRRCGDVVQWPCQMFRIKNVQMWCFLNSTRRQVVTLWGIALILWNQMKIMMVDGCY